MCIAIVAPAGKVLTRKMMAACWNSNPDGGGFAFVRDGKLEVVKGLMTSAAMQEAYTAAVGDNPKSTFLIHFRVGTSGGKTPDNTHPFLTEHCAVIHNGVLFSPPYSSTRSDTRMLIEDSANLLTKEVVTGSLERISRYIGRWNKLAFLFPDGTHAIANEQEGEWHEGVWYSQLCYKAGLEKGSGLCTIADREWSDYLEAAAPDRPSNRMLH